MRLLPPVVLGLLLAQAVTVPTRPNILFFLSDDQRDDQLGAAGHPVLETPTIDALAAGGTRFTNAFVTTAISFTFGLLVFRVGAPCCMTRPCP